MPSGRQLAQIGAKIGLQLRMLEYEFDVRTQIAELGPAVVPHAFEFIGEHGLLVEHQADRVGQLDFATGAALRALQQLEDARCQDVAADNGEIARRVLRLRLLDHLLDFRQAGADRSEEHTSELQSLMRISYAVFCLKKKTQT